MCRRSRCTGTGPARKSPALGALGREHDEVAKALCVGQQEQEPIDPGVDIGHVHLKVADLERALADRMGRPVAGSGTARLLADPALLAARERGARGLASGGLLEVLATDPGSVKDFAAWSRTTGHELVEQSADGGVYRFVLRRK